MDQLFFGHHSELHLVDKVKDSRAEGSPEIRGVHFFDFSTQTFYDTLYLLPGFFGITGKVERPDSVGVRGVAAVAGDAVGAVRAGAQMAIFQCSGRGGDGAGDKA